MSKYNHAFDLAFEVVSEKEDGSDVTPAMFRAALMGRMADLDKHREWREAMGAPFDTYEEEGEAEIAQK